MLEKSLGSSPWGAIQRVQRLTTGISKIQTAGHGGIRLSQGPFSKLSDYSKTQCIPQYGYYYLEEDCNAQLALVELLILTNDPEFTQTEAQKAQLFNSVAISHARHLKKLIESNKIDLKTFISNEGLLNEIMEKLEIGLQRSESEEKLQEFKANHPDKFVTSRLRLKHSDDNFDCMLWTLDNKLHITSLNNPPEHIYNLNEYKSECLNPLINFFANLEINERNQRKTLELASALKLLNQGLMELVYDKAKKNGVNLNSFDTKVKGEFVGNRSSVNITFSLSYEGDVVFREVNEFDLSDLVHIYALKKLKSLLSH